MTHITFFIVRNVIIKRIDLFSDPKAPRPLPKQIQRIRQNSVESNSSSNGSQRGPRTASVRLISSTSSQLSDLPEDLAVGNDDVIDEAENNHGDGFEGMFDMQV